MAEINEPQKVLPIAGLICAHDFTADMCHELSTEFGPVILKSEVVRFDHTTYYNKEMGSDLTRQWYVFGDLILPDTLVKLKHKANAVEKKYPNKNGGRKVNIDPGLISLSNLVLVSTKNYSHRIYLGQGIYAEVTLVYKDGRFNSLDWTYPDYRENMALKFFARARAILKDKLAETQSAVSGE
ncbi:hypothetical protein AMJ83_10630 [candidate division WOR_3 bacterium SM23_42]|uniref:GTP-binding protein n=1 Tax=candidate division WOR_3 bacterium SM23_42 TaxID=1703779 RepID=A0A0S8FT12_UNCW3|nr:MAG: hypothetical protein AMJ83_10630 [candidate division WOR_3 bacterium SM23_42]